MAEGSARIVLSADDRSRAAFASMQRNIAGVQQSALGLAAPFRALLAPISLVATAIAGLSSIKGSINLADQLGKLSERSGITIENLSALRFAGELAEVSIEELGDSLKKLNVNIAGAARGEKEQAEAFKAISVSVKDAAGNVRSADAVLGDIADRFSTYENGANKVALANALGGKSFEKLIPLLNGGRAGIEASRKELEKYGGVMTAEFSKASQEFNDNLTRLGFAAEGLKIKVAGGLIENLARLSEEMVKGVQASGPFAQAMENLLGLLSGRTQRQFIFGRDTLFEPGAVNHAEQEAARLKNIIVGVENALQRDPGNQQQSRRLDNLRAKLADVEAQAQTTAKATREATYAAGSRRPANEGGGGSRALIQAPALPSGGASSASGAASKAASDALAALKKSSEGRVSAIEATLNQERDVYRFQEGFLKEIYDQGAINLSTFYSAQDETRRTALAATRTSIAAEIAEQQKLLANPLLKGPEREADREEIANRIAKARKTLADAERESDQAATTGALERLRLTDAVRSNVASLEASIKELAGDRTALPLLDIAQKVSEARRLLADSLPAGADASSVEPQVQQYRRLLDAQLQLNQARENFSAIGERLQISEERIALAQQTGALSENQALEAQGRARSAVIEKLEAQLRVQEAIAAQSADDSLLLSIERTRLELDKLKATLDPLKDKFDNLFKDAGSSFFGDLAGGKGLKAALGSFGRIISDSLSNQIGKAASEQVFGKGGIFAGAGASLANVFRTPAGAGGPGGPGTPAPSFSLAGILGGANPATTVPGFAGGQIDIAGIGRDLAGLGTAASGSADVLGQLPNLAAIPATSALASLAGAAQIAANRLLTIGSGTSGAPGIGNLFGSSFGLENLLGGGFGTGTGFGLEDLGQYFNRGGYTGNKGEADPVGVVHGKEFVFSAPAVRRLGVDALDDLHNFAKSGASRLPGYQQGGYVGTQPAARPRAPSQQPSRGGDSYNVDLRGLTVQSNGQMDRMAEERSARNIARTAERYLSRRGA